MEERSSSFTFTPSAFPSETYIGAVGSITSFKILFL